MGATLNVVLLLDLKGGLGVDKARMASKDEADESALKKHFLANTLIQKKCIPFITTLWLYVVLSLNKNQSRTTTPPDTPLQLVEVRSLEGGGQRCSEGLSFWATKAAIRGVRVGFLLVHNHCF